MLEGLALARSFFTGDESPVGEGASDLLAGLGDPERIALDDVLEMNRTMRARSPHKVWADIVDAEAPWLRAVPADLDLLETAEARWRRVRGDDLVATALAATIGKGRGMSVATKLLHLKRPRLFPMLDAYVAEMLGAGLADGPAAQLAAAVSLTRLIRSEGRRNMEPLRAVRRSLSMDGRLSLVRLLDAIVWSAHPAAGARLRRTIDVRAS